MPVAQQMLMDSEGHLRAGGWPGPHKTQGAAGLHSLCCPQFLSKGFVFTGLALCVPSGDLGQRLQAGSHAHRDPASSALPLGTLYWHLGLGGACRGQPRSVPPLLCGEILPTIFFLSLGLTFLSCKREARPLESWWAERDFEIKEVLGVPEMGSFPPGPSTPPAQPQPSSAHCSPSSSEVCW